MCDNKNFVLQYIVRVTIAIINIITISLNSIIATKIVKIRWMHFTDVHVSEQSYNNHSIYGNFVLTIILRY